MNVFNRIAMALLCLTLIAGSASLIALAWTIDADTIAWLRDAVDWIDENNSDLEKGIFSAIAAAVGFFALLVLLMELTPKSSGEVKVTDLQVGNAVLSTAAIGQRIEEAVRGVPHVADIRTYVKAKRKGVVVALDLHVDADADLAEVTDQVSGVVRDVLTNRVHVALAEPPRVRLNYRELRMNRGQQRVVPPPSAVASEAHDESPPADAAVTSDGNDVPVAIGSPANVVPEAERGADERKPD